MSMEFGNDNEIRGGGGGALMGLLAGSALNRDRDDGKTVLLAAIVFVIVFIIAIIAFAMMFRDGRHDRVSGTTDYAALLTPLIAAKSMESNGNGNNFDMLEVKQKLEHNEDRAETRRIQDEQNRQTQSFMQLGFGLSGQIRDTEKTTLENFAKVENQLGMQGIALQQLLQKSNNDDIINGVIQKLCGSPCMGRC